MKENVTRKYLKFYIDGAWVDPVEPRILDVENPATETVTGRISLGTRADVDRAVSAARRAFPAWSSTSREGRLVVLGRIVEEYQKRMGDIVDAVTEEMGAPTELAQRVQVPVGLGHLGTAVNILKTFVFEEERKDHRIVKEAIGVCGLITPWNWPLNQILCKIAPALASGCTIVLKPSEIAPFSSQIVAEIMHAAGLPAGVFNLVNGDGPGVGAAIASHPGIDMVSFTGSTRAGIEVAIAAAPTVKRVSQELGGKSPNIILDDAGFVAGVARGVAVMMVNAGQTCSAPTRMLVPRARMNEAIEVARATASRIVVGDPRGDAHMGPVASRMQFDKVQRMIQSGIDEGATLVAGGIGRPEGLDKGYFVRPTVFANVTRKMLIAREEIFGPVLSIMTYDSIDEAIEIANDTEYGLAAYVYGQNLNVVREVASRLRAGQITINDAGGDLTAPFGGYKMSGNGREWGDYGFHEFLETKAIVGYTPKQSA